MRKSTCSHYCHSAKYVSGFGSVGRLKLVLLCRSPRISIPGLFRRCRCRKIGHWHFPYTPIGVRCPPPPYFELERAVNNSPSWDWLWNDWRRIVHGCAGKYNVRGGGQSQITMVNTYVCRGDNKMATSSLTDQAYRHGQKQRDKLPKRREGRQHFTTRVFYFDRVARLQPVGPRPVLFMPFYPILTDGATRNPLLLSELVFCGLFADIPPYKGDRRTSS